MTKAQYQREQLLKARQQELALLASTRANADPRYVRDAVDYVWKGILERKLKMFGALPSDDRKRMDVLFQFESLAAPVPAYFGA